LNLLLSSIIFRLEFRYDHNLHVRIKQHYFNYNRFIKNTDIMNTNKYYQWNRIMYLTLIPIAAIIFIFKGNVQAQEFIKETSSNKSYKLDLVSDAPIYLGCEKFNSEFEIRECLSENVTNHFNQNFDFDLLKNLKTKRRAVSIRFSINENGDIDSERSPYSSEEIEKEALRVINEIPKMSNPKTICFLADKTFSP